MKIKLLKHLSILVITIFFVTVINAKLFASDGFSFLTVYGITITAIILSTLLIAHFKYKDPSVYILKHNLNKGKKKPLVSCVFAVYNEEKYVGKCIESLINSDYKNKEIIVINDASTDNTLQILKKYAKNPLVKVINLKKNVGKKKAIAEGLKVAKGEFYVFTDSDSIVAKDAIRRCVEVLIYDENIGAVNGHTRAWNGDKNLLTKIQDSWYEGQFSIKKAVESSFGSVTCISGPLGVFRKSAIFNFIPAWEHDSFLGNEFKFSTDRTMTGFVLGSTTIGAKLKKKYKDSWFVKSQDYPLRDWKTVYCKSAKVWTNVPDTFKRFMRQQARWRKSFIRSIFFTGRFYWKKPLFPALLFYFKIIIIFAAPFIVIRQLLYLPASGSFVEPLLYLGGIASVGFTYGLFYKFENPRCHKWIYRPLMSLISTLILTWVIFYSLLTIKDMTWHRS